MAYGKVERMRVPWLQRVCLMVVLAACSSQPPGPLAPSQTPTGVTFKVDRDEYSASDTVTLTLANDTEASVGFNLCAAVLEREDGDGGWAEVSRYEEEGCTLVENLLPPGLASEEKQPVQPWMKSGLYRFRDRVGLRDGRGNVEVISNEFRIRR